MESCSDLAAGWSLARETVAFANAFGLPDRECGRGRRVEHPGWWGRLFLAGT
jgi:hypothetical protein